MGGGNEGGEREQLLVPRALRRTHKDRNLSFRIPPPRPLRHAPLHPLQTEARPPREASASAQASGLGNHAGTNKYEEGDRRL